MLLLNTEANRNPYKEPSFLAINQGAFLTRTQLLQTSPSSPHDGNKVQCSCRIDCHTLSNHNSLLCLCCHSVFTYAAWLPAIQGKPKICFSFAVCITLRPRCYGLFCQEKLRRDVSTCLCKNQGSAVQIPIIFLTQSEESLGFASTASDATASIPLDQFNELTKEAKLFWIPEASSIQVAA